MANYLVTSSVAGAATRGKEKKEKKFYLGSADNEMGRGGEGEAIIDGGIKTQKRTVVPRSTHENNVFCGERAWASAEIYEQSGVRCTCAPGETTCG